MVSTVTAYTPEFGTQLIMQFDVGRGKPQLASAPAAALDHLAPDLVMPAQNWRALSTWPFMTICRIRVLEIRWVLLAGSLIQSATMVSIPNARLVP